jgi:hypothetical protein
MDSPDPRERAAGQVSLRHRPKVQRLDVEGQHGLLAFIRRGTQLDVLLLCFTLCRDWLRACVHDRASVLGGCVGGGHGKLGEAGADHAHPQGRAPRVL